MLLKVDELPVRPMVEPKPEPKLKPVAELLPVRALIEGSLDHWFSLNPSRTQTLFVSSRDFAANQKPPAWLVDGILTELSLSAIVGPTGSYKSFLALDLGTCISLGKPFHGRETKQANVLLILGEGAHGIPARQKGLHSARGYGDLPDNLFLCTSPIDLLSNEDCTMVADFIKEQSIELVVVDTFARCFSADENSSKDVGQAVMNITKHFTGNGASTCLIHHTGHGVSDRARGSSAWRAALDAEIGVTKLEGDAIKVTCWKMKDAEPFDDLFFKRRVVSLPDGGTTLVLDPTDPDPLKPLKLNPTQTRMVNTLRGQAAPWSVETAVEAVGHMVEGRYKKQPVVRLLNRLTEANILKMDGEMYRFGHGLK